jgi:ElaB/YqjD/DUF883 family membrane-anchored ribosome-binding protein
MANTGNTGNVKNKVQDTAAQVGEKAREVASSATDKAKSMASSAAQSAGDFASTARDRADDAASSVGGSMKSLADTVRDRGPHGGMFGSATSRVADTLESGGHYLQQEGFSGMAEDLTALIRNNPIPALFIGFGVGCLVGLVLSRR